MLWFKEHSREIGGALAIGGALYLLSKLRSLKNRREKSFFRYRLNDSKDEIVQEVNTEDIVKAPKMQMNEKSEVTNWFGNHSWKPTMIIKPTSLKEIQDVIKRANSEKARVRAVGSLHSFSDSASILDGRMVLTSGFDKVLHVDSKKMTIKAEAGILLGNMYLVMKKYNMSFRSIPNVDNISLGGAIANSAHGTNRTSGTLCSIVLEIEIVISDGSVLTLHSNAENGSLEKERFEAVVCSIGNIGIIYSITLQCVPSYNVVRHHYLGNVAGVQSRITSIFEVEESVFIYINPHLDFSMVRSQMTVHPFIAPSKLRSSFEDWVAETYLYSYKPGKKKLSKYILGLMLRNIYTYLIGLVLFFRGVHMEVLSWDDGEIMVKSWKDPTFLNCEYALPQENIEKVSANVIEIVKKHQKLGYLRTTGWAMRNVGADTLGFLSTSKGRATCYIDLPYQQMDEQEFAFFREVEFMIIAHGGRASWSRRFNVSGKELLVNYPDADKYVKVVKDLDPHNMFTNSMRKRIFDF